MSNPITLPATYLQNSFNKNNQNFENYKFEIIELVKPINCIEREQYYINFFNSSNPKFGYNRSPTAGNCLGVKHTLENKIKKVYGIEIDWWKNSLLKCIDKMKTSGSI